MICSLQCHIFMTFYDCIWLLFVRKCETSVRHIPPLYNSMKSLNIFLTLVLGWCLLVIRNRLVFMTSCVVHHCFQWMAVLHLIFILWESVFIWMDSCTGAALFFTTADSETVITSLIHWFTSSELSADWLLSLKWHHVSKCVQFLNYWT